MTVTKWEESKKKLVKVFSDIISRNEDGMKLKEYDNLSMRRMLNSRSITRYYSAQVIQNLLQ
jgi:hypothetical protein